MNFTRIFLPLLDSGNCTDFAEKSRRRKRIFTKFLELLNVSLAKTVKIPFVFFLFYCRRAFVFIAL